MLWKIVVSLYQLFNCNIMEEWRALYSKSMTDSNMNNLNISKRNSEAVKLIFMKILQTTSGVLGGLSTPHSGSRAKPPEKYETWGFPIHSKRKIFTLFLGIKVLVSTSNFTIFQGIGYYKTVNTTEYHSIL